VLPRIAEIGLRCLKTLAQSDGKKARTEPGLCILRCIGASEKHQQPGQPSVYRIEGLAGGLIVPVEIS
jgi:hypothetical protein